MVFNLKNKKAQVENLNRDIELAAYKVLQSPIYKSKFNGDVNSLISQLGADEVLRLSELVSSNSFENAASSISDIENAESQMNSAEMNLENNVSASNSYNMKRKKISQLNIPNENFDDKFEENINSEEDFNLPDEDFHFESSYRLYEWLEDNDLSSASNLFKMKGIDVTTYLEDFYNSDYAEEDRVDISEAIYDSLPVDMKGERSYVSGLEKVVSDSLEIIKKAAKKYASKKNNIKLAQHKTINDNVIMWSPSKMPKIDPFYRQPVSDWHIVERNKAYDFSIGDIYDIDYEAFWRQNIMDKYSRPYRDKDGNWVGGYINKRFEVNSYIPEGNSYQLKPGQLRSVRLPQYGTLESRMQHARSVGDIEGEPEVNKEKPTDWNDAKSWGKKAYNLKDKKFSLKKKY